MNTFNRPISIDHSTWMARIKNRNETLQRVSDTEDYSSVEFGKVCLVTIGCLLTGLVIAGEVGLTRD